MNNYICVTCGTQFSATNNKPEYCPICEDERQYVPDCGQQWITREELKKQHKAVIKKQETNLYGIGTTPAFAIGQRALLITTPKGNILWDCLSFIDETLVDIINAWGGLDAIAISHPHYYSSMVDWSRAFDDAPIYLHKNDQQWIQQKSDAIKLWEGDSKPLTDDLTLYNAGGHFEGGTILHWSEGSNSKGALLTGDILQVAADHKHVSFMYSYPNNIPINANAVNRITRLLDPLPYHRIYGAWWDKVIPSEGKEAVKRSARRYIKAIS